MLRDATGIFFSGGDQAKLRTLVGSRIISLISQRRKRLPRLLSAVARDPEHLGIGLDENMLIEGNGFEVIGAGVATVVDAKDATIVQAADGGDPITLFGLRLHLLPGLADHHCAVGRRGGFLDAMARGTYFGHVAEHVELELSSLAGREVHLGRTMWAGADGRYDVTTECPSDEPADSAVPGDLLRFAVDVVHDVLARRANSAPAHHGTGADRAIVRAGATRSEHCGDSVGGQAARHPGPPGGRPELIGALLRQAGMRVGPACTDGVWAGAGPRMSCWRN